MSFLGGPTLKKNNNRVVPIPGGRAKDRGNTKGREGMEMSKIALHYL